MTKLLQKYFPEQYPSGRSYDKNDAGLYDLLYDRQVDAIRNAEKLLPNDCKENKPYGNPSTTVVRLVKELNKLRH